MLTKTKEELLDLYATLRRAPPKMVTEAEPGQVFVYGYSVEHLGSVALHKWGEKPAGVFPGLSVEPVLPDDPRLRSPH